MKTEILIIIVALVVFGSLMLRLFMVTEQANNRTNELASAVNTANGLVEAFRRQASLEDYLSEEGPYSLSHAPDGALVLYKYYSGDWQPAQDDTAPYVVKLVITPDPAYGGDLVALDARACRRGAEAKPIASLNGVKYFGLKP